MDLLQEFYETTLEALKDAKNDRLWFKTNTKVYKDSSLIAGHLMSSCTFKESAEKCYLVFTPTVGKAVLGEGGVWKTAKDP